MDYEMHVLDVIVIEKRWVIALNYRVTASRER